MEAELYGWELVDQYEKIIGSIAEWRTNMYSILNLVSWKKQIQPRMQSDIGLIQNALMLPANYDIGDFTLQQVNQMINFKTLFDQLISSHKQLIHGFSSLLSIELLCELEQKTGTLITYFDYSPHASLVSPIHLAASLNHPSLLGDHMNFQKQHQQGQSHHHNTQQHPHYDQNHQHHQSHEHPVSMPLIVSLSNLDTLPQSEDATHLESISSCPSHQTKAKNPLKSSLEQVSNCSTWVSINSFTNCGDAVIEIE